MKEPLLPARFGPAFILLSAALAAPVAIAAQQRPPFEFGVAGGYHIFDNQLELASGVGIAGRLGIRVAGPIEIEGEASYTRPHTDTPLRERVGATTFGGWLLLNQGIGERASVFLKGGYASVNFGKCPTISVVGSGPCGSAGVVQGGLGARFALTPMVQMRYDATVNRSLTDLKFSNVTLQAGIALMLGGATSAPPTRSRPRVTAAAPSQPAADTQPVTKPAPAVVQRPAQVDSTPVRQPIPQAVPAPAPKRDTVAATAPATTPAVTTPPATTAPNPAASPNSAPATKPTAAAKTNWTLPGSVWPYRGAILQAQAFPALDSIARIAKEDPSTRIEISGYAFDRLIPADDKKLSQYRADAVKSYLTFKGIPVSRITAVGKGSTPLIDKGDSDDARTANRRVEIRLTRAAN